MQRRFVSLAVLLAVCCLLVASVEANARRHHTRRHRASGSSSSCPKYVTTDTLAGMSAADIGKIKPPLRICPALASCQIAFQPNLAGATGPLGPGGPLGWAGPLGSMGPLSAIGAFGYLSKHLELINRDRRNPLSNKGPLGPEGYKVMLDAAGTNDFMAHLQGLGAFGILGPLGPLGALGPLGPVGPNGPHGYTVSDDGVFKHKNGSRAELREAAWDERSNRSWPMVEVFGSHEAANKAAKNGFLDTSFVVTDSLTPRKNTYKIAGGPERQIISILAFPVNAVSSFNIYTLEIEVSANGKTHTMKAKQGALLNWAQIEHVPGATYKIKLDNSNPMTGGIGTYRLIVVGSVKMYDVTAEGPFQKTYFC